MEGQFKAQDTPNARPRERVLREPHSGSAFRTLNSRARHRDAAPQISGPSPRAYFSWSATLSMPALAQTSSLSPPGEPETPIAPMTSSPTLIGSAPCAGI
jgi:hypothetical protein